MLNWILLTPLNACDLAIPLEHDKTSQAKTSVFVFYLFHTSRHDTNNWLCIIDTCLFQKIHFHEASFNVLFFKEQRIV